MAHEPLHGGQIDALSKQFSAKGSSKVVRRAGLHASLFLSFLDDVVDGLVGNAAVLVIDLTGFLHGQE